MTVVLIFGLKNFRMRNVCDGFMYGRNYPNISGNGSLRRNRSRRWCRDVLGRKDTQQE